MFEYVKIVMYRIKKTKKQKTLDLPTQKLKFHNIHFLIFFFCSVCNVFFFFLFGFKYIILFLKTKKK